MGPSRKTAYAQGVKALVLVLALASQTFWTISTGPVPSPYPSPSSYPVNWYGVWYYPLYWPICTPAGSRHCRPLHAPLWPPPLKPGQHAVPKPPR